MSATSIRNWEMPERIIFQRTGITGIHFLQTIAVVAYFLPPPQLEAFYTSFIVPDSDVGCNDSGFIGPYKPACSWHVLIYASLAPFFFFSTYDFIFVLIIVSYFEIIVP